MARKRKPRKRGRTAASRAASELRHGSSEAGRLLGEIGQDIHHEGYHRNPEVVVEEYEGLEANPGGTRLTNAAEIRRKANRLKRL